MAPAPDIFTFVVGCIIGAVGYYFFILERDKRIKRSVEKEQKKCNVIISNPNLSNMDKMFNVGKVTAYADVHDRILTKSKKGVKK